MSIGTNQERIEQNNAKLANLKTGIDNLPEYQDIEPIYAASNYKIYNTKSNLDFINNIDNYFINTSKTSNTSYGYIKKINDDNSVETLLTKTIGDRYNPRLFVLLDKIDDKLYYLDATTGSSSSTATVYEFDINTKTETTYDSFTISNSVQRYPICIKLRNFYYRFVWIHILL